MAVRLRDGTVIYASEAQIEYVAKQIMGEAMNEGLVAPSWSDSGEVPVGEVTYMPGGYHNGGIVGIASGEVPAVLGEASDVWTLVEPRLVDVFLNNPKLRVAFSFQLTKPTKPAKPSDPNAKPSLPSLSRVSGEAYRGLGWCDE